MSVSDPIADFLTIIRNGLQAKFKYVDVPASGIKHEIAKTLKKQGYLGKLILIDDGKQGILRIWLKYDNDGKPIINMIKRASRPGLRDYRGAQNLPRVRSNLGLAILTTPNGVMTAREAARQHVGGEVLCYVW